MTEGNQNMKNMTYIDYKFTTIDGEDYEEIAFDEELDAESFMDTHGIEEGTLFSMHNVNGQLVLTLVYEDEPDEGDEEQLEFDFTSSNNVIKLQGVA